MLGLLAARIYEIQKRTYFLGLFILQLVHGFFFWPSQLHNFVFWKISTPMVALSCKWCSGTRNFQNRGSLSFSLSGTFLGGVPGTPLKKWNKLYWVIFLSFCGEFAFHSSIFMRRRVKQKKTDSFPCVNKDQLQRRKRSLIFATWSALFLSAPGPTKVYPCECQWLN